MTSFDPSTLASTRADWTRQLDDIGYVTLDGVFTRAQCDAYKQLLEELAIKYGPIHAGAGGGTAHGLQDKSLEQVVYNLHNKDYRFFQIFEARPVLTVLDYALKRGSYQDAEPYCLLNISARNPRPGNPGQQLHLDSNLPGGAFPLIMVALWMLDDFTIGNGATRLYPGSHKFTTYAEDGKTYPEEISVTGSAGSVLIYNGSLWHGGGAKTDPGTCWAVVLGYGRWFIKPSFDFPSNTPAEIWERMTPAQRDLLGFRARPPADEFTRIRRRSTDAEPPSPYRLPR